MQFATGMQSHHMPPCWYFERQGIGSQEGLIHSRTGRQPLACVAQIHCSVQTEDR